MALLAAVFFQLSFLVLTLTTGIFGGAALLILYRTQQRSTVYGLQVLTLTAAGLAKSPLLLLLVFCMNLLIWIYVRLEQKSLYKRALVAVGVSTVFYVVALLGWAHVHLHENFWTWIGHELDFYIKQSQAVFGDLRIDTKMLAHQLPSFIATMFSLNLWFAVLFDSKAQKKFGILRTEREIKNFKAPEFFIWIAIAALLFSFVKTPVPWLQEAALNVLNVSLLLYFFQGLSVVSFLMEIMSVGVLIKVIVYFIFIAQLLLPICLGILDFWLNFRHKISKRKHGLH